MQNLDKFNAEVFLEVVKTGSFKAAASNLGYTQAGISYIISTMEKEANLNLFYREHGGVKLSPEGEQLLPAVRQLHNAQMHLSDIADDVHGLETGTVNVVTYTSVSIYWLPGILKKFSRDYPGVEVRISTIEDFTLAEQMIYDREVDCGFLTTGISHDDLDLFPLMEEPLMAAVSPDHPLADEEVFPVDCLDKYPYIMMSYGKPSVFNEILDENDKIPQISYETDNDYAAMAMVSQGLGFCIFPQLYLFNPLFPIKVLPFDKPKTRTISIATRSFDSCAKAGKEFIRYSQKWVEEYKSQRLCK